MLKPREGGAAVRAVAGSCHVILTLISLIWLFPLLLALVNSFRDYAYTAKNGYVSWGGFTLDNYKNAWAAGDFGLHFTNSLIITVPAVILTLFLSCCVAFVVARFSYKFNLALLGFFLAANLLPPQALLIPVYRMFRAIEVPLWVSDSGTLLNSFVGLILVNMAFQIGFCAFVLSNYMKALPARALRVGRHRRRERARGSSSRSPCRSAVRPSPRSRCCRRRGSTTSSSGPPCCCRQGDKYPVTSSINNLRGQFFTDNNLVAAGSVIIAVPTLVIFFVLQRHFVAGLTLGATKG